jgi:DNA polymerase-3 subunit alpha
MAKKEIFCHMPLMPETFKRFSSLHNHSYYSLLDATQSPIEVVRQAYNFGFGAVALTEHGVMFSMIEGYKEAKKLGMQFIFGVEAYETTNMLTKDTTSDRYHLILLAKSETGLKNLFKIVSESSTTGFYGKARIDLRTIEKLGTEDVICMSACLGGRLSRLLLQTRCACCDTEEESIMNHNPEWYKAFKWVAKYKRVFGENFYIELQNHDTTAQALANKLLLKLAQKTNTKYTITFDTHMLDGSHLQMDIHRKFLLIGADREAGETYTGCWQVPIEGIHEIMDRQIGYEAVEIGINTTDDIANQCDVEIELGVNKMPHIHIPPTFSNERKYLEYLINEGWKKRGFNKLSPELKQKYKERLHNEIETLDYLDYCSYFIMTKQLVDKFKEKKIPLGYSRGSGGNCLVFYTIGVTEVDSIKWDLDFSRFANKGRKSVADYDMDISQLRRQEAIEITIEMFGEPFVAQLATFNRLSPKVCIRDLGKVFDEEGIYSIPYAIRDKIAKLIPDDASKDVYLEEAMEISPQLKKYEKEYPLLFEYAKHLQYLPKSSGCHASALILAPNPIIDYAPIMYNKTGNVMIQLEMGNAMDDLGLTKLDLLGLVTTDVVDMSLKFSGLTWDDIDLQKLDLDDQRVFKEIYETGNTLGIFQMEKYVVQEMYKNMKPDTINDVFAVNAMNRPAILSVGMDKVYIHNKNNPEDLTYIHKDLKPIVDETHGIMLYQEQALKIFKLAGFPDDETDNARRAIGKKKADVMAKLYGDFASGLEARRWIKEQIDEIWNLIEAQSSYSFNKGHSTAYGLLSYVTAWLKLYYPVQFMTALLISEIGDYSKTSQYINEARRMGIEVLPPNINESGRLYSISGKNILFGLESLKGVGVKAVELIMQERLWGEYISLSNFLERCTSEATRWLYGNKIDSSTVIALIQSGAFGMNKEDLMMEYAFSTYDKKEFKPLKTFPTKKKMMELELISTDAEFKDKETCLARYNEYKKESFEEEQKEKMLKHFSDFKEKYMNSPEMYEFNTMSIFLNGNPFDDVAHTFKKKFEEWEDDKPMIIAGTITDIQYKKQKNGGRYAFINVLTRDDGMIEGTVFNSKYMEYQDYIKKGNNLVFLAKKSGSQFIVDKIKTLSQWKTEQQRKSLKEQEKLSKEKSLQA